MTKMLEECWTYLDSTQGISNGGTGGKHESSSLLFRFRPPLHGCMVAFGLYGVHSKHGWLSQNILIITLTRMYGSMIHIQNISFSFIMSHELWAITAPVPRYSSARIPETESPSYKSRFLHSYRNHLSHFTHSLDESSWSRSTLRCTGI